jgi:hypothetical protein
MMSKRRTQAYINALVSGRRPRGFRASPEDAAVIRAAIDLKTSRGEPLSAPSEQFVSSLFEQLTDEQRARPGARRPRQLPARGALVAASAAALVGATIVSTEAIDHRSVPAASTAGLDQRLRSASLLTAENRRVGQITVYRANPSWVFMNIEGSSYNGRVICKLQAEHGATVATGTFDVDDGSGQFAQVLHLDVRKVRSAQITTPAGAVVAKAVFS